MLITTTAEMLSCTASVSLQTFGILNMSKYFPEFIKGIREIAA